MLIRSQSMLRHLSNMQVQMHNKMKLIYSPQLYLGVVPRMVRILGHKPQNLRNSRSQAKPTSRHQALYHLYT